MPTQTIIFFLLILLLSSSFLILVSGCPDCKSKVNITDDYSSRMDFSHKFIYTCTNDQCSFTYSNFTSDMVKNDKKGRNMFDVSLKKYF